MLAMIVKTQGTSNLSQYTSCEDLFRDFYNAALFIGYRHLQNMPDAEEAATDAIYSAWKTIESEQYVEGDLDNYVRTIASNKSIDIVRQNNGRRGQCAGRTIHDDMETYPDSRHIPFNEYATAELLEKTKHIISFLPERTRHAFELHCLEEIPVCEVANTMEVPIGTVYTWISVARKKIRQALAGGTKELQRH